MDHTRHTTKETVAYRADSALSRKLYRRATQVMPGGNTRHSIALTPYPIYAKSGKGCHITDVEGEERIDFLNNFTSLILGHADPVVTQAVHGRIDCGTAFTMPTETDVELAELFAERVPYIEHTRFCNSGSEAVMLPVKAARAYTGRHKIAKFEGAYHGIYDYVQVSEGPQSDQWGEAEAPASIIEGGMPLSIAADVVVMPCALAQMLGERGLPHTICGKGSLFLVHLTDEELTDYRSFSGYSRTNPIYAELCHEMLARGIVTTPRGIFGCLSTPMTEAELDAFVDALDRSLTSLNCQ